MSGPCPSCQNDLATSGTRLTCARCKGAMVTTSELEDMLHSVAADDIRSLDERLQPGGVDGMRACPTCQTPMIQRLLAGVTIDRCLEHGVWFDGKELAAVLERSGDSYADREWARNETPGVVGAAVFGGPAGAVDRVVWRGLVRALVTPTKPKDI